MYFISTLIALDGIEISLNQVGKTPKLIQSRIKVKKRHTFQSVITFVRTQLEKGQALQPNQSLVTFLTNLLCCLFQFLYINSQFAPSPNERINDLYEVRRLIWRMICVYVVLQGEEHAGCQLLYNGGMGMIY